ncbi:MAG: hypothetical protein ABFS38_10545 [Bacteroidota bacterium]
MSDNSNKLSQFWQELKRRRVIHVITVYASAAFVLIELINNLTEPLNLPSNLATIVIIVLAVGFPLAIVLSWLYDLTSAGVEKTRPLDEVGEEKQKSVPNAWKIATYVSFVVIVGLLTLNIVGGSKELRAGDIQSMVVLPFDNYTGDDQLDYFVSGMHASLIGDMGKIGGLRVISKTSSNTYKDVDMSIPEIASELGVDAVVEPSVMCLGDSICLQVRIITPYPEEKQLWIAEYKEEKSQILNLYNRVTKQIANEVRIELSPDEERVLTQSRTVNKEAYDDYLMGLYYWDKLGKEPLEKALEYFNSAIETDPEWAPPYAGVAQVWVGMAQMGFVAPQIAGPIIFENLNRALELDLEFAASHFTQAAIAVWTEWNWEKGEKEFLKALSINPNDAMSRIYYAHLLMHLQKKEEALAQGQQAVDLDPLNPLILGLYAVVLSYGDQWEEAHEHLEKAISIDPYNYFAHLILEPVSYHVGDIKGLLKSVKFCLPFEDSIQLVIEDIAEDVGMKAAYREIVNQLEVMGPASHQRSLHMANRYAFLNQYDKAMELLETGFENHDNNMPYIACGYGKLEALYDNPRYIALMEKLNLPMPED